ncbi:MAG TPA: glycoside hydrolase family 15 protein [Stellaceae bacterium]|nr:glycoside hydrolase family 15 protein [Stellaceae bacterium]
MTEHAPGAPGIPPTWTSNAKDMVGCALGTSRLWFTLGFGIVNEVYYPQVDIPQIRDLGFIVADGEGFWAEVKRIDNYQLRLLAPGVPAVEIVHRHERYSLLLRIAPGSRRDILAIECRLDGDEKLTLYVLLAPHLGATGYGNVAAVMSHHGRVTLCAERGPFGVALAAVDERQRDAIGRASAGYVGTSDGWQDFARNGRMTWDYRRAGPGNVALLAELPRRTVLALGFGSSAEAAATLAIGGLLQPFDNLLQQHIALWQGWQAERSERYAVPLDVPPALADEFLVSTIALRSHLDKTFPGAMVASLSIPWGDSGNERGGYHLVWPRDLVETAGAFLALGADQEARDTLRYLSATQLPDGHWHQNQWLDGTPYWQGVQLDETAFPVLLAAALEDRDALSGIEAADMVRRALGFIARTGPATEQDRWEESAGLNPFTLAVTVAALIAGAGLLPQPACDWATELADFWNSNIERWTSVRKTPLANRLGVAGYYVLVLPGQALAHREIFRAVIPIHNRPGNEQVRADELVGTEFLQLVRFGLRRPDDALILDSIRVADALLKTETPSGPVWHRYNCDGYGEHDDGSPYDGTGRGRGWPLLTGERGHYELIAGRDPLPYLEAMCRMTSPGGMLPEQVWDADPIPSRRLIPGRPTGSAMPLVWAHAEFIKLLISRHLGHPVDRPRAVWQRYRGRRPVARHAFWWPHAPIAVIPAGALLAVALSLPAIVHWGRDGWLDVVDIPTSDSGLNFHVAVLEVSELAPGTRIDFTWQWRQSREWRGRDYAVMVEPAEPV